MGTILNWGKDRACVGEHSHWSVDLKPCRLCGKPTPIRDCDGAPCHKTCAEEEIDARE